MAQHHNEHLTMAQLSAYLDQELTADELAVCTTHLHTCQDCQSELADFRFTSTLLHNMPQVEVPRSFVLPTNLVILPTTPASTIQPMYRTNQPFIKRTLRTLSTLAAVVGLFFILAGALTSIPFNSNTSTATTTAPYTNATHNPIQGSSTASNILTPLATATRRAEQPALTRTTNQALTPPATASTSPNQTPALGSTQQLSLPAVLDPAQPTGRLSIGAILLLLGILGILWSRRLQRTPTA